MKSRENFDGFVKEEMQILKSLNTNISWEDSEWNCSSWLFHRGSSNSISFRELGTVGKKKLEPLPYPYMDFCKAVVTYLQRTKGIGFIAVHKYTIECRRLFGIMKERGENEPSQFTRWHFERALELLNEANYKNFYDASASLKVIADVIVSISQSWD
ncbi:MAG: hypothetical protein HYR67_14235 [Bacteroidetes bacterium]|nr:hypothetical protein [Bacteroidota bacterium]